MFSDTKLNEYFLKDFFNADKCNALMRLTNTTVLCKSLFHRLAQNRKLTGFEQVIGKIRLHSQQTGSQTVVSKYF